MFHILRQNNSDLLREIVKLKEILYDSRETVPDELMPYYNWVIETCDHLYRNAIENLKDIDLEQQDIVSDILSKTQAVEQTFRLFNQRWVSPVLRTLPSDSLCLKILRWLHASSPRTEQIPVAFSDEEFSILPMEPSIYFMPSSSQHGLLYLSLFFHEYGHLLYRCHKPEMDDLTRCFQMAIADLLEPNVQRNDRHAQEEETTRATIVETWYGWMQEIFCDAVGFHIGGPAFLRAFSMYLRMHGRNEFKVPVNELAGRSHPVTFLRIRLLSDLVNRMGYNTEADKLEEEWEKIALTMGITEDYFGYYEESFLPDLQQTIDDMLAESSPQMFSDQEDGSPVELLNQAWQKFDADSHSYPDWEAQIIEDFLKTDLSAKWNNPKTKESG